MQIILFFVSCIATFYFYYLVNNITLQVYAEDVPLARRLLFVAASGLLLDTIWIYLIYLIGGSVSFSPIIYVLVTIPNPFFALLIYYFGVKIQGLSPYRSLHIMVHTNLYFIAGKMLNQFISASFFVQPLGQYNYLSDAVALICCACINTLLYCLTSFAIRRSQFIVKQTDQMYIFSLRREIFLGFLTICAAYGLVVLVSILMAGHTYAYLMVSLALALSAVVGVLRDARTAALLELSNKDTYINGLVETTQRFEGLRHDFMNILQSYAGYIASGEIDGLKTYHSSLLKTVNQAAYRMSLSDKMQENPALITLLNAKLDYAERSTVKLTIDIDCQIENMYIDNMDLCRSLAALLDNAIEAAAESSPRSVDISIKNKPDGSKLIIIMNSTAAPMDPSIFSRRGFTTKEGHTGIGLSQVRKTLSKYGNCTFQVTCFEETFTAYISTKRAG